MPTRFVLVFIFFSKNMTEVSSILKVGINEKLLRYKRKLLLIFAKPGNSFL